MRWVAIILTLIVALAAILAPPLRLTVETPLQYEPAYIRLRIRVEPDEANRALTVGIVSDVYETSSLEQLEGLRAPITRWVTYKDVPAGDYQAVAEVWRPGTDSWHVQSRVIVLSRY